MSPTTPLRPSTFSRLLRASACALALGALALPAAANIPLTERQVLLDLFSGTDGQNWTHKTGWGAPIPGDECSWFGVTCVGDNVTEISLWGNGLAGTLPTNLKDLTELKSFNVSENALSGAIPALPAGLQVLTAYENRLTGAIPPLPAGLQNFSADDNLLTGAIPDLPAGLQFFAANNNQLTSAIPDLPAGLQSFAANNNRLSGAVPDLPAGLQLFAANDNRLTGSIPALPATLVQFEVDSNQLTGAIPTLPNGLLLLRANDNQLSGPIPTLPSSLVLLAVSNNQLSGPIPTLPNGLEALMVGNNQLTGALPAAPAALEPSQSTLCPNLFDTPYTADPAWDAATGSTPWSAACRAAPPVGVPTLGEWALLLLGLAAAGLGARRLRARTH